MTKGTKIAIVLIEHEKLSQAYALIEQASDIIRYYDDEAGNHLNRLTNRIEQCIDENKKIIN